MWWEPLLLLGSSSRVHWAVDMGGGRRSDRRLGIDDHLVGRAGLTVPAGGDSDLHQRLLSRPGVWHSSERAAARHLTDGRLGPTLALDWDAGSGTKILLELIDVRSVVNGGAGVWQATLTPSLSGKLVLSRAELASSLSLLLERLLLLGVGVADLDLQLLASRLDRVVVECLDDFFARVTRVEAAAKDQCLGQRSESWSD